jgi:hypothetical protein
MVSVEGQPEQTEDQIKTKFEKLQAEKPALLTSIDALEAQLAVEIGPQMFRGEPVLGGYTKPTLGKDHGAGSRTAHERSCDGGKGRRSKAVTRRQWGTLYLVRPEWHDDTDHPEKWVVEPYRNGPSHIQVAIELWRLAGRDDRAQAIEALLEIAYERDRPFWNDSEATKLLETLDDLDVELEKKVVGSDWLIPQDKLPDLRRQSTLVDLDEERGPDARAGIAEAMSRVTGLREFLRSSVSQKFDIAVD